MPTQKQVGARLAELRKRVGLTQANVAEKLGISDESVSRLERGTQWTDFDTLVGLAQLYQVAWSDLLAVHVGSGARQRALVQEVADLLRNRGAADIELARDLLETLFRARSPSIRPMRGERSRARSDA